MSSEAASTLLLKAHSPFLVAAKTTTLVEPNSSSSFKQSSKKAKKIKKWKQISNLRSDLNSEAVGRPQMPPNPIFFVGLSLMEVLKIF